MRKPSFGGAPPGLELPTYEFTSPEATPMYPPSDQSIGDVERLAVFDLDVYFDERSVISEADKEELSSDGPLLFGVIPFSACVLFITLIIPLIPLAIGLVLYFHLRDRDYSDFRSRVYSECSNRATAIEKQLSGIIATINGVALWLDMTPETNRIREEFDNAIQLATINNTNAQAVRVFAYAPRVNDSNRAAWESQHNMTIKESSPDNSLTVAGTKPYYYPIMWEYPVEEFALGFDISSTTYRSYALNRSLEYREPAITTFLKLVVGNTTGFCVYYPIYKEYAVNQELLSGAMSVCFAATQAIDEALDGLQDHISSVTVKDHLGEIGYQSTESMSGYYNQTLEVYVLNNTWKVTCTDYFEAQPFSAVILSIVLLIGILAATSVYICSKTYRRTSKDAFIHKYKYNRSKRRAEAILQSIPDPIIVLNGDGRVVECNQQAIDVFGAESKKRLLGCHIKHIFGANQESLVHDNLIQPGLHEIKVKRHNSSDYFMAEANFAYAEDINDDDNEKPFMTQVVLLRDISAKIESALQLQKAKQEAEESNQKKSQFLSFVCHELRNPLHVISGMSDLLESMVVQADKQEYVRNIITSSNHMQSIVNDVLDIAQLSEHELRLNYQPMNLRQLLEAEGKLMKRAVEEKGGEVINGVVDISDPVPEYVNSDSTRITQLIKNLVDNAIKFTEKGVITLKVSVCDKERQDPTRANVMFLVSDTGIGIPPEQQNDIFQPFSKPNISMGNRFGSSGVGLSIVYHLIDLMGGSIELESEVNVGTNFTFILPFALATEEDFLAYHSMTDSSSSYIYPRENLKLSSLKIPGSSEHRLTSKSSWADQSNISNDHSIGKNEDQTSLLVTKGSDSNILSPSNTDTGMSHSDISSAGWSTTGLLTGEHESDISVTPTSANDSHHHASIRKDYFGAVDAKELDTIEEKPVCLVAEDNDLCQKIALKMLGKEYVVELADNGKIAVDTIMAAPDRFSIIIMDIIMPEMDGIQATIELRKRGITIPIIAVTANAAEADKSEAMTHGFNDYITKPYKRNLLVAMENALKAAKQSTSASQ